ncbi:MAG: competence/damage-inducible protein A [Clostridia bacterium]|nr:competence/damage-inducible protein A [Clostridia bacterium]
MASFDSVTRSHPIRTAEILCVGTELLLGDIVNTNAAFLSKRLASLGIAVYHQTVVGDHPERLRTALTDAFEGRGRPAADLVILSGGLGPTYDDLTKETVATYFGRSMLLHEESLTAIRDFFTRTGRTMTPNNEKQAMMPEGCVIFPNHYGTAPALAVGDDTRTAIMLPGPPVELIPIFDEMVIPFLRQHTEGVLVSRNIHIMGLGESAVESILHDMMVSSENPTVAPYCKSGEVRLRITARAQSEAEASALCDATVSRIRENRDINPHIYGIDCDNIETALVRYLSDRGLTLATAESCTGGMVGQRITGVSGASAVYLGGFVTYTNEVKINQLGVSPATIAAHTEVSAETACEMAEGARKHLGADIGISTTGYAGPTGGTEENPVGTVFVAVATKNGTTSHRLYYPSRSRGYIREAAASRAMMETLRAVMGEGNH